MRDLAQIIDQHAIAPALAERPKCFTLEQDNISLRQQLSTLRSYWDVIEFLNRTGFDLTECRGRWCVLDYKNEKSHYGNSVEEAVQKAMDAEQIHPDEI